MQVWVIMNKTHHRLIAVSARSYSDVINYYGAEEFGTISITHHAQGASIYRKDITIEIQLANVEE